ncbi:MAG TPA: dTMP kinase [Desulfomonilia bacterium]|nr:dTMP kinase [Desulfomonilia bacterium]
MIITFEGGEGSGKTTNAARLCTYLTSLGLPWLSFREPGGSDYSEEARRLFLNHEMDVMAELLLILSSRRQNITEIVEPGLAAGKILVIDRFIDSTLVYQGILGGLGPDLAETIMKQTLTWIEPDLTFVMDVDPHLGLSRIRPGDRFERRGMDFHRGLREAFLQIAVGERHRIIDTSLRREVVQEAIIHEVDGLLAHIPRSQ